MINVGKFVELGHGGKEHTIAGDMGEKMVNHIWNTHDTEKEIEVKEGDTIYVRIEYDAPAETNVGVKVNINTVSLEKAAVVAVGENEKFIKIAKITKQGELRKGSSVIETEIKQLWKSDITQSILGTAQSCSSLFSSDIELDVVISVACGTEPASSDSINMSSYSECVFITPTYRTIKFCGELGSSSVGDPVTCCS